MYGQMNDLEVAQPFGLESCFSGFRPKQKIESSPSILLISRTSSRVSGKSYSGVRKESDIPRRSLFSMPVGFTSSADTFP